jgi:hypothetical protein
MKKLIYIAVLTLGLFGSVAAINWPPPCDNTHDWFCRDN